MFGGCGSIMIKCCDIRSQATLGNEECLSGSTQLTSVIVCLGIDVYK